MEVITNIIPGDPLTLPQVRSPLALRNIPSSPTPLKHVKHKPSMILRADSSEELPSPHSSIFEATGYRNKSSDENGHDGSILPPVVLKNDRPSTPTDQCRYRSEEHEDRHTPAPLTPNSTAFIYGHGTLLDTISEKKSIGTMCTFTTSVDSTPTKPLLGHRDSLLLSKSPRRRNSFSLDDLAKINRSYHEACAMIEGTVGKPLNIHKIYAEPNVPHQPPLERPGTPPGLPSWTAAQNIPRNSNRTSASANTRGNLLQRFFGFPDPRGSLAQRHRSVSEPLAPRFRAPRSMYSQLRLHPFNIAPTAKSASSPNILSSRTPVGLGDQTQPRQPRRIVRRTDARVRFTPSATARDSEMLNLQNAIEATSATAINPLDSVPRPMPGEHQERPQCPHRRRSTTTQPRRSIIDASLTEPPSIEYATLPSTPTSFRSRNTILLADLPTATSDPESSTPYDNANSTDAAVATKPARPSSTVQLVTDEVSPMSTPSPLLSQPSAQPYSRTNPFSPPQRTQDQSSLSEPSHCWRCKIKSFSLRFRSFLSRQKNIVCLCCCGWERDDEDVDVAARRAPSQEMREARGVREIRGEGWIVGA